MPKFIAEIPVPDCSRRSQFIMRREILCLLLVVPSWIGCSGLQPIHGVPSDSFPQEMSGPLRSGKQTIDLSLLRQTPPPSHIVDSGDVLGVYIEGVMGNRNQIPPVNFPASGDVPPSFGYPMPVREDGTISLPLIKPILVRGMTIREVEEAVRKQYTQVEGQRMLNADTNQVLISLQRPRTYNVLVVRQEATNVNELSTNTVGSINLGSVKRGSGKLVALPAYKNDVLHALAETGGLPGLDAENTVYVLRRRPPQTPPGLRQPGSDAPRKNDPTERREPPAMPTSLGRAQSTRESEIILAAAEIESPDSPFGYTAAKPRAKETPARLTSALPGGHSAPQSISHTATQPRFEPPPSSQPAPQLTPNYTPPVPPQPMLPQQSPPVNAPPQSGAPAPWLPPEQPWPNFTGQSLQDFPLEAYGFGRDTQIVRIPVRLYAGETPQFREQDIILNDGDIVFIESRDTEIFYTGGLLGGGQYTLPRDYDLDVLGAVSIATGRTVNISSSKYGGVSALNQDVSVGASDVTILRQLPGGGQIPIKVDLNKAIRDPQHRVRIQPGDYILLRYKPHEAVAAFIERNLLAGGLLAFAATAGGFGGGN